ncbi:MULTISPECIES: hypothetical protein [unclassified Streptomyces]|uniref:hypothetical protein n=1 Tax=unclassified Streptomyces TaxID=2593676 RepID=UPI0038157EFE
MDATVAAGWIGGLAALGGAVIGAWIGGSTSLKATKITLQAENDRLREERLAEQERQAISNAMTHLYALRTISRDWYQSDDERQQALEAQVAEHLGQIGMAVLLIRDPIARERMDNATYMVRVWHHADTKRGEWVWITFTAAFALALLSTYARGESGVPEMKGEALRAYRLRVQDLEERGATERLAVLKKLMASGSNVVGPGTA